MEKAKTTGISRVTSLLLCAALASAALISCGSTGSAPADDERNSGEAGAPAETEAVTEASSAYPELEVRDLGGENVNILIRSEWNYEFLAEEESGDLVPDSILKRNTAIEDRYNCKLSFIDKKGDWSNHDAFANSIHSSVMAGDGAFDFVAGYQACLVINIQNGDFLNLLELPHFAFDAPWWTREGLDALTINGKCYEVGGDIAVSLLEGIFCMFCNKTLAAEFDTENLYDLVRSGKWTHEAMMRVIRGTGADLDGDGKFTKDDRYGFLTNDMYIRPYGVTYDTPTLGYDTAGDLTCVWNTPHTVSVLETLVDMAYDPDVFFTKNDANLSQEIFRAGRSLITPSRLGLSAQLRDMDDDFGILPYPKFDENQKNYRTTTFNEVSMISMPITCPDPEKTALIVEAMCRESHTSVAPAFYEHALKGKYTRDADSAEMIDLIRSTLSFDCGWINSIPIGVSGAQYYLMVQDKDKGFASWYAKNESSILAKLDAFKEVYYNED